MVTTNMKNVSHEMTLRDTRITELEQQFVNFQEKTIAYNTALINRRTEVIEKEFKPKLDKI